MNIGEQIKKYRKKAKKTQWDLANSIGCYPQTVSYWENGRPINTSDLEKIADALDITISELLGLPNVVTVEVEKDIKSVPTYKLLEEIKRRTFK